MSNIKEKVLNKIFEDPSRKFYIRELAREINISPNSVITAVEQLKKEGLVIKTVKKHVIEIAANLESPAFIAKKRIFNLNSLYESGMIDYLVKSCRPKALVAFGSYSRGEDVKKSDIDIAVITDAQEKIDIESFEKKLNRKIHLLLVDYKKISDEFYTSLINGIVLYGFIDRK